MPIRVWSWREALPGQDTEHFMRRLEQRARIPEEQGCDERQFGRFLAAF
jgi:hypothetical protein